MFRDIRSRDVSKLRKYRNLEISLIRSIQEEYFKDCLSKFEELFKISANFIKPVHYLTFTQFPFF